MGKLKDAIISGEICEVCMCRIEPPTGMPTRCDSCIENNSKTEEENSLEREDYF